MKITERKRPLREVRKDTMVPGVIYGKSITSTPIEAPLGRLKHIAAHRIFRGFAPRPH